MDVRAGLVGVSGRQLHGLRHQRSYSIRPRCYCCLWGWWLCLRHPRESGHCPGRRELQIRLGQGAVLTSTLPKLEPKTPSLINQFGVFELLAWLYWDFSLTTLRPSPQCEPFATAAQPDRVSTSPCKIES